jgi:hypothetical protein
VRDPSLAIPQWTRRPSGLVVPGSLHSLERAEPEAPAGSIALPESKEPTAWDQVAVYIDETAANVETSTLADMRALIAPVPFFSAARGLANIAAKVHDLVGDTTGQIALARELYGEGPLFDAMLAFLRDGSAHRELFAEQHVFILFRVLIEAADHRADRDLRPEDLARLNRALLAATSVAGAATAKGGPRARDEHWGLALFVQSGAYNRKSAPLGELARAQELFGRIARDPGANARADNYCDVDDWMGADYGLTIEEQMAVGFALSAMTHIWDEGSAAGAKIFVQPRHLDDLLAKLGFESRRAAVLDLVSATREEFEAAFAAALDEVGSRFEAESVAWELRPFFRHPFLRTPDDGLIALSPRAIQAWLSDGFHYRLLDAAQRRARGDKRRKISHRYTAYSGELLEEYVLELTQSVYPGERPPGGGRVHGEQRYGRRGQEKTSDVAIDLGVDLVLVEVSASRLRADTVVIADPRAVLNDLDRTVSKKIGQLDHCINQLLNGNASIPGVEIGLTDRIWPVIVTAGNVTQNPLIWGYLNAATEGRLAQTVTQPVTLLDLEDYEQLCGLIEGGHSIVSILERKTQLPYRDLEFAIWLTRDANAPGQAPRPSMVEAAWERSVTRASEMIDFTRGFG